MILSNPYPVCEFDSCREPLITPGGFMAEQPALPPRCVITFFRRELLALAEEKKLPVTGWLHSEVLDIPIYRYRREDGEDICITMPFLTAPGAACTIEELHALGCRGFVICGGAGALCKGSTLGEVILPTAALRDEGTSYHYLPPAREVACHPEAAAFAAAGLERLGIPYTTGKTWTTDAIYRETPALVEARRDEGCLTVEMEAAAFFAVSQYHGIPLAQLLYAGDDVSGESWDSRGWDSQRGVRWDLIQTAIRLTEDFPIKQQGE